jgi:hypothetical protein
MSTASAEPKRRISTWIVILDILALAVTLILFLQNASVQTSVLVFLLVSASCMSGLEIHFRRQPQRRMVAQAARMIGLACRLGAVFLFVQLWLG